MHQLIYTLVAILLGAFVVGFFGAMGVRRDEIRRNPTLPGKVGKTSMIVFAILILGCMAALQLIDPCQ